MHLTQILLNLVINASDAFTDGSGEVVLRTHFDQMANRICLMVEDNGPGISPELHEKIFDPFWTTKGQQGTGLGLSTVREMVEFNEGEIELLPVDQGSTFMFVSRCLVSCLPQRRPWKNWLICLARRACFTGGRHPGICRSHRDRNCIN